MITYRKESKIYVSSSEFSTFQFYVSNSHLIILYNILLPYQALKNSVYIRDTMFLGIII